MKIIAYDCYNHNFIEEGLINTVVPQFSRNDLKSNGTKIFYIGEDMQDLRIRKLTPRECFRLMGVKDEDFDKVKKNQSDSSLYHLAGDSICVPCLMALFSQLLDIKWEDKI
jgi:site-specific DNA-cytosine methylase